MKKYLDQLVKKIDLDKFCRDLLRTFSRRQLILLKGELGAGKTTFVQECARVLGFSGAESPTFSIINEYPTSPKIIHVDLYRMQSAEDIESTGFWDLFEEEEAYLFVEWPERIPEAEWPRTWSPVMLSISRTNDEDVRQIQMMSII